MATKNSYLELDDDFHETLKRSLQVPYNEMILIDDGQDKTKDIVRCFALEHSKKLIINKSNLYGYYGSTRATARQTAIDIFLENFSDDWLLFIDDDAWLQFGWWNEAVAYTFEPKAGLIWGIDWPELSDRKCLSKAQEIKYREYAIENFLKRGGTHDTLLRREAIEDISIPPFLHIYEDTYILKYVLERSFDAHILESGIIHMNNHPITWRSIKDSAKFARTIRKKRNPLADGIERKPLFNAICRLARVIPNLPFSLYSGIKVHGVQSGLKNGWVGWKYEFLNRLFQVGYIIEDKNLDNICRRTTQ